MSIRPRILTIVAVLGALLLASAGIAQSTGLSNPYRMVAGWAKMLEGCGLGTAAGARIDADGKHIWAGIPCDAAELGHCGNQ